MPHCETIEGPAHAFPGPGEDELSLREGLGFASCSVVFLGRWKLLSGSQSRNAPYTTFVPSVLFNDSKQNRITEPGG